MNIAKKIESENSFVSEVLKIFKLFYLEFSCLY